MKIKDIPKIEQPREKLQRYGAEKLNNAELLAIILGKGRKGENAIELAKKVLKKYPPILLSSVTLKDLSEFSGIGKTKSTQVIASIELGKRLFANKISTVIMSPKEVWKELENTRASKKEHFIIFFLDVRNQVIKKETISIGTLNASIVHPRELFEPAIKHSAAQIILSHNHPSGEVEPSKEDIILTKHLMKAGDILGIEIIDHVIVAEKGFLSLKEKKLI